MTLKTRRSRASLCPQPIPFRRRERDRRTGAVLQTERGCKPCNRRTCDVCGPRRKRQEIAHFQREVEELYADGWTILFATLTLDEKASVHSNGKSISLAAERANLAHVLDNFFKRLRRRYNLKYCGSIEPIGELRPHLHLMIAVQSKKPEFESDTFVADRLCMQLAMHWGECGGGIVCEIVHFASECCETRGRVLKDLRAKIAYTLKRIDERPPVAWQNERVVLASQGLGFNSAHAKRQRKRWAEEHYTSNGGAQNDQGGEDKPQGSDRTIEWVCLLPRRRETGYRSSKRGYVNRPSEAVLQRRSRAYQASGIWKGRCVTFVHQHDPATRCRWKYVYDRDPDDPGATCLAIYFLGPDEVLHTYVESLEKWRSSPSDGTRDSVRVRTAAECVVSEQRRASFLIRLRAVALRLSRVTQTVVGAVGSGIQAGYEELVKGAAMLMDRLGSS